MESHADDHLTPPPQSTTNEFITETHTMNANPKFSSSNETLANQQSHKEDIYFETSGNGNLSESQQPTGPSNQEEQEEPIEEEEEAEDEEEPDWEQISQHEPAQTDVPIFLSARDRRDAAFSRFGAALDECHANLKNSVDELLSTAASIHHVQSEKLDELEMEIKQHFIGNEEKRAAMHQRLQESATAAQGLFSQLLQRVSQPLHSASLEINALLPAKGKESQKENEMNLNQKRILPMTSEASSIRKRSNMNSSPLETI